MPSAKIDTEETIFTDNNHAGKLAKKSPHTAISEDGWALLIGGSLIAYLEENYFQCPI